MLSGRAVWLLLCDASRMQMSRRFCARPIRRKERADGDSRDHFVDFARVRVFGGKGGDGGMSFASLPFKEWAGPDGGNGGNGGHVVFRASDHVRDLSRLKALMRAKDGVKGRSDSLDGTTADHLVIDVPRGTVINNENEEFVAEVKKAGDIYIAARGGAGGKGNRFFLNNENRAPTTHELGANGEERLLFVELRIMASAGLVGFPNAGKSSLLRAISRARPRVAAYPFTTLNPSVGMVEYDDDVQVAVADIPGLVAGAHKNHGLGHSFLRHIQRCGCLLFVLDLADDPLEQLEALRLELEMYEEGLSRRPHAIIGNKIDLPRAQASLEALKKELNMDVFAVSAKYGTGVDELLQHLRVMHDSHVQDN